MTTGAHFSATQVETFDLCPRKWAWRKIAGLKSPKKKSAQLGVDAHEQLANWLRDGVPLNLTTKAGNVAMSGIHHLPAPRTPGLRVEESFALEIGGHTFIGYKDFEILEHRSPPLVSDHKTTVDFRWAKTADDLRKDVQACLYAADAMFRTGANECDLQWTYLRTQGAEKSQPVRLRVTRDDVTPTLAKIVRSCDAMSAVLVAGMEPLDLPPNANACEAFGGCEYRLLCNLTNEERLKAIMTQQNVSANLLETLKARQNGVNPPPQAPPQFAPAQPPAQPPEGTKQDGWIFVQGAWMKDHSAQPAVVAPPVAAPFQTPDGRWFAPDATNPAGWTEIAPPPQFAPAPLSTQIQPETPAAPAPRRRGRAAAQAAPIAPVVAPALLAEADAADDDAKAELQIKLGTLFDQMSAMMKTAAEIVRNLQ